MWSRFRRRRRYKKAQQLRDARLNELRNEVLSGRMSLSELQKELLSDVLDTHREGGRGPEA